MAKDKEGWAAILRFMERADVQREVLEENAPSREVLLSEDRLGHLRRSGHSMSRNEFEKLVRDGKEG